MNVIVHKGELYAFRSLLISRDLNLVRDLDVRKELVGSAWEAASAPTPRNRNLHDLGTLNSFDLGSPSMSGVLDS
jgi:hypothetical protein